MGEPGKFLVYSVTKTWLAVLCLRLELDLDAPVATWVDDPRLPRTSLRRLLNHTSGIPDYGRLPEYAAAVRSRPSRPWDDDELLARALAAGPDFAPGEGWAYSNTGYLLVRRILQAASGGGLAPLLERELLTPLGLHDTAVAEEPGDLAGLVPARSSQLGDGDHDVRGLYHPAWVGHRALVSTEADQRAFWRALAAGELCDLETLTESVEIGYAAPGFARPSYGLGVMTDPGREDGLLIGHGGGGPGYAAAAFALLPEGRVEVVLSADERLDAIGASLQRLGRGSTLAP